MYIKIKAGVYGMAKQLDDRAWPVHRGDLSNHCLDLTSKE